jgi:hypothetical protein
MAVAVGLRAGGLTRLQGPVPILWVRSFAATLSLQVTPHFSFSFSYSFSFSRRLAADSERKRKNKRRRRKTKKQPGSLPGCCICTVYDAAFC